jgi:hypothetical protein
LKDPLSVWHAFQCYIIPKKKDSRLSIKEY